MSVVFHERSSTDTQPRVGSELFKKEVKVIGFELDVGIEARHQIEGQVLDTSVPVLKSLYLGSKATVPLLRQTNQLNPLAPLRVFLDNRVSVIRGAITDDHPAQRQLGLRHHRFKCAANIPTFIARGCNDDE